VVVKKKLRPRDFDPERQNRYVIYDEDVVPKSQEVSQPSVAKHSIVGKIFKKILPGWRKGP
tara:strand:+ start:2145 stop:2327 length:183 start_codon:yes stop_codon:yes gene_type:complete